MLRYYSRYKTTSKINPILEELKRNTDATLKNTNAILSLTGFTKNLASSLEEEMALALKEHFHKNQKNLQSWCLNHKIFQGKLIVGELDGVFTFPDRVVIMEAKSTVREGHLYALKEKIQRSQIYFNEPNIEAFIGGKLFSPELRKMALDNGFGIVVVNGKNFSVISENIENEKHSFRMNH